MSEFHKEGKLQQPTVHSLGRDYLHLDIFENFCRIFHRTSLCLFFFVNFIFFSFLNIFLLADIMFQIVENQLWELSTERAMFSLSPATIGLRGRCILCALGVVASLGDLREVDITLLGTNCVNCFISTLYCFFLVLIFVF